MTVVDAVSALLAGEVVAIPTDTVYGLAASVAYPDAVDRLFELKHRPVERTVAVLVDVEHVDDTADIDPRARRLVAAFWPGPLTIVVPAAERTPRCVVSADETVGLRCADHHIVAEIISHVGPIATTSANLHGQPPPSEPGRLAELFPGVLVVDGGIREAPASSVVRVPADAQQPPEILRSGTISAAAVERALASDHDNHRFGQ